MNKDPNQTGLLASILAMIYGAKVPEGRAKRIGKTTHEIESNRYSRRTIYVPEQCSRRAVRMLRRIARASRIKSSQ